MSNDSNVTDHLLEHYRKLAGISEEQMAKDIEEQRKKNPVPLMKTDIETVGNALIYTFQNDNQLGELVMSLFIQVNDLATLVLQLQTELEELKMLNLYRYMVDNNMKKLVDVPEPYQSMLREEGYTD